MFLNALVKMTASVTDVFCITQITYIVINNALLIDQSLAGKFKYFKLLVSLKWLLFVKMPV